MSTLDEAQIARMCVAMLAAEAERDRYKEALEAVILHDDIPAGESWGDAYREVVDMCRAALAVPTSPAKGQE